MGDPAGPLAPTKLQLAPNAAPSSLRQLLDTDYVALWTFPKNGRGPYQFDNQILPIGALRDRRGEIDKTIDTLEVHGDTPLYSALQEAHTVMAAFTDPRYINAIVVLSDGHNNIGKTSPSGAKESDGLLAALRRGATSGETDSQRLRVFSIAYGADSDKDTLRQISAASQAATYDASNPQTLDDVMADVLSNF